MNPLLEALKAVNVQCGAQKAIDLISGLSNDALKKEENLRAVADFLNHYFHSSGLPLPFVDNCLAGEKNNEQLKAIAERLPQEYKDYLPALKLNEEHCVCNEPCLYLQYKSLLENRFHVSEKILNKIKAPCYSIVSSSVSSIKIKKNDVLTQDELPKHLLFNVVLVPQIPITSFKVAFKNKLGIVEVNEKDGEFNLNDIFDFSFPLNPLIPIRIAPSEPTSFVAKFDMIKFPSKEQQLPVLKAGLVKVANGQVLRYSGKNLLLEN